MIRTIKKNENNDIDLSTGKIQFLEGLEGLSQRHSTRLKTFQGEWFFDESIGIPYIGNILGAKKIKVSDLKAIFIEELVRVEGTESILEIFFDEDAENRKLTVSYKALADNGEILNGELTI